MELKGLEKKTKVFLLMPDMSKCKSKEKKRCYFKTARENFTDFKDDLRILGAQLEHYQKLNEILTELSNIVYNDYSTLMFIRFNEDGHKLPLPDDWHKRIYKTLSSNPKLCYVTKILLICDYEQNPYYISNWEYKHRLDDYKTDLENFVCLRYINSTSLFERKRTSKDLLDYETYKKSMEQKYAGEEYDKFQDSPKNYFLENFGTRLRKFSSKAPIEALCSHIRPKSELNKHCRVEESMPWFTTSSLGCYMFSVQYALFIGINHRTFDDLSKRKGSEKDIEAIRIFCGQLRIPHMVAEDASAEEVRDLLDLIRTTDLSFLKHLFLFVMSHGTYGDYIHTKTGTYNAQDVIDAVLKNESLRNVKTLIVMNYCRGDYNAKSTCESEPSLSAKPYYLDDTTVVIFSSRPGYISERKDDGSPCVQIILEQLVNHMPDLNIRKIHEIVERELVAKQDYLDQISEFCAKEGVELIFNMELTNLMPHIEDFRKLESAFKVIDDKIKMRRRAAIFRSQNQ